MKQTVAISSLSLLELEQKKQLKLADSPDFFLEWRDNLTELSAEECQLLDRVQQEYFEQLQAGISEGLIKLIVVSPLLHLAGFYRQPQIRLEKAVELEVEEADELWRGRIDILVIQNQLWVLVVESKGSALGIDTAIPQALGYMLAAPAPEKPTFGLVTNGGSFLFLKLMQQEQQRYQVSDVMLLLPGRNQLYTVLRVLKQIKQAIAV